MAKYLALKFKPPAQPYPSIPGMPPAQVVKPSVAIETERPWFFRAVSDSVLASVYSQLGRMLDAGVSLTDALRLVIQHSRGRLAASLASLGERLEAGSTLTDALAQDPVVFPGYARSLVEAGEKTGALPAAFFGLAQGLELHLTMRRRMLRVCFYPFVLFTLSFFLIPLSKLFVGGLGAYLRASLVPYLFSVFIFGVLFFLVPWGLRRLLGPASTQRFLRLLPVAKTMYALRATVRFSRHLSVAIGAGLDLTTSLNLASRASGDVVLIQGVEQASRRIQQGAGLAEALAGTGLFDDQFMLAVSAGEMSGRLEQALGQQARLAQDTLLHRLELVVQVASVVVLILVYAYTAWSILAEYRNILGGTEARLQDLLKELGSGSLKPKGLPSELRDLLH